jgi:hypothetical protein
MPLDLSIFMSFSSVFPPRNKSSSQRICLRSKCHHFFLQASQGTFSCPRACQAVSVFEPRASSSLWRKKEREGRPHSSAHQSEGEPQPKQSQFRQPLPRLLVDSNTCTKKLLIRIQPSKKKKYSLQSPAKPALCWQGWSTLVPTVEVALFPLFSLFLIYFCHSPWCFPITLLHRAAPGILTCNPNDPD